MNYKANIWKMNLFMFLRGFQIFAAILVPFFTDWVGLNFFQISILLSAFTLSVFLFEIPTGVIADKFGRKTSLVLSGFFNALSLVIYSLYPNFYVVLIAEIIWGFSVALMSGANDALVYDSLKILGKEKESKNRLGKFRSFDILAIGIAAPLGSYLSAFISLQQIMFFSFIGPFLAFIIALTLKEPPIMKTREKYFTLIKQGIYYLKKHKELKILAFDQISTIIFIMFMFIAYQQLLISMDFQIKYLGFVHALLVAGQVLVLYSFNFFDKFISKRKLLLYFGLIPAILYICIYFTSSIYFVIIMLIIAQGLGYPRDILFINYFNKYVESDKRATVLSVISMAKSVVFFILYPFAGLLMDVSPKLTLLVFGFIMIIAQIFSRVKEEHLID